MDVSRGALRRRLLAMRAWDSQGKSLDEKINEAINQALDRMATDVPEALLPDEEHVALQAPVRTGDDGVEAYVRVCAWDKRLLEFVDAEGVPIDSVHALTRWRPRCTGEWDGIMHIEVKGPDGRWYRRQCREFFYNSLDINIPDYTPQPEKDPAEPLTSGWKPSDFDFAEESFKASEKDQPNSGLEGVSPQVSGYEPVGPAAGTANASRTRAFLATRLGVDPSEMSDEVFNAYLKQGNNRRNRVVNRQGAAPVFPKGVKGNHGIQGNQSYDAINGVDESLGLNEDERKHYHANLVGDDIEAVAAGYERKLMAATLSPGATGAVTGTGTPTIPSVIPYKAYMVTIDRPWRNNTDGWLVANVANTRFKATDPMEFRLYQPEFFVRDDVMEINEPAVIWDDSRQQVWGIDTGGADRASMRDFRGEVEGRPFRMFRGRHFQLPAPTEAPLLDFSTIGQWAQDLGDGLKRGAFKICYTYVWGRRDKEWQQAPNVSPFGHEEYNQNQKLWWAHDTSPATLMSPARASTTGITDPTWESAPSPISQIIPAEKSNDVLVVRATNIDAHLGFSDPFQTRFTHTGLRLRFYISYTSYEDGAAGNTYNAETNDRFYLLCEVEPTYDQLVGWPQTGCRFIYNGKQLYDIERPLKHSTGYYAWKTYPAHDARYELDFRVTRLPQRLFDDQDTPPIQRGAISALTELAAYYVALLDGADQGGAQLHLDRYNALIKTVRNRYANPGRVVEPKSLVGGVSRSSRNRFGTFDS